MGDSEKHNAGEKVVLEPNHPLLNKFQKALKETLVQHITKLKNEIFEIEAETKQKNAEKEQLGIQVYEAQQMVCKQQKTLEEAANNLIQITTEKEKIEEDLCEHKRKCKDVKEQLVAIHKSNLELQKEINSLNLLVDQVSEWEKLVESKIKVNQRIDQKTRKDHQQLIDAIKYQDVQIYKVIKAIWKLETEIETMTIQLQLKEVEREELECKAVLGNTNLDALQAEYRCLMHSWNSVVVAVSNRDRIMDSLKNERQKIQVKMRSVTSQIEQTKKITKDLMNFHERLTISKNQAELFVLTAKQNLDGHLEKYRKEMEIQSKLQAILQHTDFEIARVNSEIQSNEAATKSLEQACSKVLTQRTDMEHVIVENILSQQHNTKAAENLRRLLASVKEKRKDLEIFLSETENKHVLLLAQIELQRFLNEENEKLLEGVEREHDEHEKEADRLQAAKEHYNMLFGRKERQVTVLNSKFEALMEKRPDSSIISPQELKLKDLEKQTEQIQEKIKNLQIFWLSEQKNLLHVSKQRQEQIYKLNLLRKQNLILEQKNLQIKCEIAESRKLMEKIIRRIKNLQNKACLLCDQLFKKRDRNADLDNVNFCLQSQFDEKLRDSELECLKLLEEVTVLEESKALNSKQLIELNQEALEWEKKVQLTKETKAEIKGEVGRSGEVDKMKQEIQKMKVMYSQLKKNQNKLSKELEHCVFRRNSILAVSEAKQKRSKIVEERTRINLTRKMDDIQNQQKKHVNELTKICKKIENLDKDKFLLQTRIKSIQGEIAFYRDYIKSLNKETECKITNRQLNFELLLLVQKKIKIFNDLASEKKPFMHYKESQHSFEYKKEKEHNKKLCIILQNLITEFPSKEQELLRLYNSLKLNVLSHF